LFTLTDKGKNIRIHESLEQQKKQAKNHENVSFSTEKTCIYLEQGEEIFLKNHIVTIQIKIIVFNMDFTCSINLTSEIFSLL